ncbi:MAG: AraC family transcriptional regulator [Oscillospiraceae bacterium]
MNYLAYHENKMRGTFDFPIELSLVTPLHPRYQMPFHWHMEYEIILVQEGEFALSLDTEVLVLHTGDAALITGGVIHGGVPYGCTYECLVFDMGRFMLNNTAATAAIELLPEYARQNPYFARDTSEAKIADEIFTVMAKEPRGYELIITGLLWQFIGTVLAKPTYCVDDSQRKTHRRVKQMKRVLRRIRTDYSMPLTLNDLAEEAGMAPKYFCRAFAETTGRTPIDYLNYYRVECAGEQLSVTSDSVTDIALSCGFNDLSYFTRTFRKYKGVSPKKYRTVTK